MRGMPDAPASVPRLRLRISPAAEAALRSGHPWLFAEAVREQSRFGAAGELAVIYDKKDKFLAVGLFDPDSPIRLRVLHAGKPLTLDDDWWRDHLAEALKKREELFDADTTGYRLIHGESDGWPGLVLDRYASVLVVKLYTAAWLPWLEKVRSLLVKKLQPERLVLRLSRNIQEAAQQRSGLTDGQILHGPALSEPVIFLENGLRFEANVVRGQKTGFFLDQRDNRALVGELARGKTVLNTFSFSGGFAVYAARGGARIVTDLDISAHALASSDRNFALNAHVPEIAACRHTLVQADTFEWLASAKDHYDLIVLDPPSLARKATDRSRAVQAYAKLVDLAAERLARDGILVACSCSAHVTSAEFFNVVRQAASRSGRSHQELRVTGHPPDHAAAFREAEYLKAIYLRFGPVV